MNKIVEAFLASLTYGESEKVKKETEVNGVIETLARVYERARNALEYRADHLVRRAAIERILKRRIIFDHDPQSLTQHLLTELKWAKYLNFIEVNKNLVATLENILKKYIQSLRGKVSQEWVAKIASAEIDELFNLNTDYNDFTLLAFQVIKQKTKINDPHADLLVYFAVDKTYAQSDDEQIAYHILKFAGKNINPEKLAETLQLFHLAKNHKDISRIIKFVRRQMPPLILLRDIYFSSPQKFREIISQPNDFRKTAREVLENQLNQMSGRIKRASLRSIIYVFLTKMVIAIGLEIPLELLFTGGVAKLPVAVNILFPPLLMWATTLKNYLPSEDKKESLVERAWFILNNFDQLKEEPDLLLETPPEKNSAFYSVFSALYVILFLGIFGIIYAGLEKIGFSLLNKAVFIFFLTIIAFFAYRISQIAKAYTWREREEKSSFMDIIALPILSIGSRLSRGLSKLNFLAFTFDFILEAPFKLILELLDSWVQFLSLKKEEEIIE